MPVIATVIESESYQRAAAQYGDARLMDEVKESFDYVLANDPYYGNDYQEAKSSTFSEQPLFTRVRRRFVSSTNMILKTI